MRRKRLRKKHIPSFYFETIHKRRKEIEELISVPVIFEMKNGEYYAGVIDEYIEGRVICLFSCKQFVDQEIDLDYTEKTWKDCDIMADFPIKDIKNIFCAKDESLTLEQILELSINPYRTTLKGIDCEWIDSGKHSEKCDEDLHESLAKLYKEGSARQETERKREEFKKAFDTIRRFILENKGRIP
jgi:hypothetical protein